MVHLFKSAAEEIILKAVILFLQGNISWTSRLF